MAEDNGDDLNSQGKDVNCRQNGVSPGGVFLLDDGGHGLDESGQGKGNNHDQVRGDKDSVAHIGSHAGGHIAGPGQGVKTVFLHNTIQTDGNAGDNDGRNQPFNLLLGA